MQPWIKTPLLYSRSISNRLDCDVWLKIETLQPPQSFKCRGISLDVQRMKDKYGPAVRIVIATGGNAGVAAASAAEVYQVSCTVVTPEHASQELVAVLKTYGAEVVKSGENYVQALAKAKELVGGDDSAVLISGYNSDNLRSGNSNLISEIQSQLDCQPDAIFCSVGGGGLLGGVLLGCASVGWDDMPIIAMETRGADCFYHTMMLNRAINAGSPPPVLPPDVAHVYSKEHNLHMAHFSKITSKACLGAATPARAALQMAQAKGALITCAVVPDDLCIHTTVQFAEEHKILIELACAATLTPAYNRALFDAVNPGRRSICGDAANATGMEGASREPMPGNKRQTVVFIVCGSANISVTEFAEYVAAEKSYSLNKSRSWAVQCNGKEFEVAAAV